MESSSLDQLASRIRGAVLEPSHADYAQECSPFHLDVVPNPAVAVVATCAEDIQEAVRYAAANSMPIAVQATGHGIVTPYDGINPLPPQYCYLKPHYLNVQTSYFDHLKRGAL